MKYSLLLSALLSVFYFNYRCISLFSEERGSSVSTNAEVESKDSYIEKIKKLIFDETYRDDKNFRKHKINIEGGIVTPTVLMIGDGNQSQRLNLLSLQNGSSPYFRVSYYFNLDKKNTFRFLIAPFEFSGNGFASSDFYYSNYTFDTANPIYYKFKFNSYRATYARTVFENDAFKFQLGVTFKIRDAAVILSQNNYSSVDRDLGFIPLIYFNFEYMYKCFKFQIEGDFLASPYGRAIDIGFSTYYVVNTNVEIGLGYRILEGGAYTKKVYNSALLNYAFCALSVRF